MEGLLFFVNEQEAMKSPEREHQTWTSVSDVKSQHLVVVLVIEHLVHGVGTQDKEGDVNVSSNLNRKCREYEIRAHRCL